MSGGNKITKESDTAFLDWVINMKIENPFRQPRPRPLDPGVLDYEYTIDDCFELTDLKAILDKNFDWLSSQSRSTIEIYTAIFRRVDPEFERRMEAIPYINEAMFDLGFTPSSMGTAPRSITWDWKS